MAAVISYSRNDGRPSLWSCLGRTVDHPGGRRLANDLRQRPFTALVGSRVSGEVRERVV